jgi:hypothetical protein
MKDDVHGSLRGSAFHHAERRSIRRQWECAMLLAGALAAASFAPHPIVLPIVSVVLVMSAALAASFAWLRAEGRPAGEFTRWDQAGILLVAGIVAALTGDSAEVLQFMESLSEARIASR